MYTKGTQTISTTKFISSSTDSLDINSEQYSTPKKPSSSIIPRSSSKQISKRRRRRRRRKKEIPR